MNAPNRYELYTLGEGESKLLIDEDTKVPNACTVTVNKEDHTLANMLRSQLLQSPYVIFAGYKVPHPLEPRFIIKVQTDGSHTPIQAIQEAVKSLILTLDRLRSLLQNEFRLAKTVGLNADSLLGHSDHINSNNTSHLVDSIPNINSSTHSTFPSAAPYGSGFGNSL